jgi:putative Mg2+ transporter-C (MgtC) family protein
MEREYKLKDAGIKTTIFICIGACIFSYLGSSLPGDYDRTRVLSQIVSGVGFICGGVVIFDKDKILGLTSAAIMWMTAAIGAMCGLKLFFEAVMCSITIILVEFIFDKIKYKIRDNT